MFYSVWTHDFLCLSIILRSCFAPFPSSNRKEISSPSKENILESVIPDFKQWQKVRLSNKLFGNQNSVCKLATRHLQLSHTSSFQNAILRFMKDKENSKIPGAFKNTLKYFIFSSILDF